MSKLNHLIRMTEEGEEYKGYKITTKMQSGRNGRHIAKAEPSDSSKPSHTTIGTSAIIAIDKAEHSESFCRYLRTSAARV